MRATLNSRAPPATYHATRDKLASAYVGGDMLRNIKYAIPLWALLFGLLLSGASGKFPIE